MFEGLKKVLGGKSDEAAVIQTASAIRSGSGEREVATLEEAVSVVIAHITLSTKRAAFEDDRTASGTTPGEGEYLVPSVMLGMLLTQSMWGILGEKFDGGKVATYVALRHCLDNPKRESMAVFAESAMKYNAMRKAFEEKGDEFNRNLMALITSSFRTAANDTVAGDFMPIYSLIRQYEREFAPA